MDLKELFRVNWRDGFAAASCLPPHRPRPDSLPAGSAGFAFTKSAPWKNLVFERDHRPASGLRTGQEPNEQHQAPAYLPFRKPTPAFAPVCRLSWMVTTNPKGPDLGTYDFFEVANEVPQLKTAAL